MPACNSLVPIKILAAYRKIAQTKLRMEMSHAFAPSYFLDFSYWNTTVPSSFPLTLSPSPPMRSTVCLPYR